MTVQSITQRLHQEPSCQMRMRLLLMEVSVPLAMLAVAALAMRTRGF